MHVLHNFDTGNITNLFVKYDKIHQIITCTSTGGPATEVAWYKDNAQIMIPNEGTYNYSQVITDTISATYENRLKIVDKSSEAAGTYTCIVTNPRESMNGSLYIQGKEHKATVLYDDHRILKELYIIICITGQ
jgi:hypothetical protein